MDCYLTAFTGGKHHHAHDALAIYAAIVFFDFDMRAEVGRELHELCRRSGVQPQLVYDFYVFAYAHNVLVNHWIL
jgi:hypothetical protein